MAMRSAFSLTIRLLMHTAMICRLHLQFRPRVKDFGDETIISTDLHRWISASCLIQTSGIMQQKNMQNGQNLLSVKSRSSHLPRFRNRIWTFRQFRSLFLLYILLRTASSCDSTMKVRIRVLETCSYALSSSRYRKWILMEM